MKIVLFQSSSLGLVAIKTIVYHFTGEVEGSVGHGKQYLNLDNQIQVQTVKVYFNLIIRYRNYQDTVSMRY